MADPDALALTLGNRSLTGFSNQGQVDWVSLAKLPLSATVATLGRISNAGIDALTIAVAPLVAICLPINQRGEIRLDKAMSTLKSSWALSEVIYFSTGVRYVLQEMKRSTQGSSCIALAACLTEGHSVAWSARVLYDLTKATDPPGYLTPTFAMWERFVQQCTGIFSTSEFSYRLQVLLDSCGFGKHSLLSNGPPEDYRATEPKRMAETLLGIGTVCNGKLLTLKIDGGPDCCWAAVYCEFMLGLRVQVISPEDVAIYENYHPSRLSAQVVFHTSRTDPRDHSALQKAGITYSLSGRDFITRWHRPVDDMELLVTSRYRRETLIMDFFARKLDPEFCSILDPTHPDGIWFADLFVACANIYCCTWLASHYPDIESYIHSATKILPELQSLNHSLVKAARKMKAEDLGAAFKRTHDLIRSAIEGKATSWKSVEEIQLPDGQMANMGSRVRVVACIVLVILVYFFHTIRFDEEEIGLSHIGLHAFYNSFTDRSPSRPRGHRDELDFFLPGLSMLNRAIYLSANEELRQFDIQFDEELRVVYDRFLRDCTPFVHGRKDYTRQLRLYMWLFTGNMAHYALASETEADLINSAVEVSGICCYFNALRDLSDDMPTISTVHIMRGHIQSLGHRYGEVHDDSEVSNDEQYDPLSEQQVGWLLNVQNGRLRVTGAVEEEIYLYFRFRFEIAVSPGERLEVSPAQVLQNVEKAYRYRQLARRRTPTFAVTEDGTKFDAALRTILKQPSSSLEELAGIQKVRPSNTHTRCLGALQDAFLISRPSDLSDLIKSLAISWYLELLPRTVSQTLPDDLGENPFFRKPAPPAPSAREMLFGKFDRNELHKQISAEIESQKATGQALSDIEQQIDARDRIAVLRAAGQKLPDDLRRADEEFRRQLEHEERRKEEEREAEREHERFIQEANMLTEDDLRPGPRVPSPVKPKPKPLRMDLGYEKPKKYLTETEFKIGKLMPGFAPVEGTNKVFKDLQGFQDGLWEYVRGHRIYC